MLSVEAFQARLMLVCVLAVVRKPWGTDGGCVSTIGSGVGFGFGVAVRESMVVGASVGAGTGAAAKRTRSQPLTRRRSDRFGTPTAAVSVTTSLPAPQLTRNASSVAVRSMRSLPGPAATRSEPSAVM